MQELSIAQFQELKKEGVWIIDTRLPFDFIQGFIQGSLFLGRDEKLAQWARVLVPATQPVMLVANEGEAAKSAELLYEAGIKNVVGVLQGGMPAWQQAGLPVDMIIDIEADELLMDLPHDKKLEVVDVRSADEYAMAHVRGAVNKPLFELNNLAEIADLDDEHNLYLHCGGGSKAIIAAALLKKHGYEKLRIVMGGFKEISKVPGMPIVEAKKA